MSKNGSLKNQLKYCQKKSTTSLVALVCDTCEQQLHVFCWREMVFDSLRIYFVNNPPFNPDSITLKNEINKIIKQAVQKVAFVSKGIYNETGWDNNGNGILDFFPNSDSVPPERLEHDILLDSIETTFNDCYACDDPQINRQTPKIIITPAEINSNWLLIENACVGSDTLIIQYAQDLLTRNFEREVEFTLSDWDGSNAETFQLNRILYDLVDADKKRMGLEIYGKTLNYDHPRHSVLKWNNSPIGITFTTTSCTWMMGACTYHDIAHEFLHMRKVGPLSHDKFDTLNLMNKNHLNPLYNLLRYRQIETDNCMGNGIKEQQWKIIRSTKY